MSAPFGRASFGPRLVFHLPRLPGRFVSSAWAASGSDRADGGVDAVGELQVKGSDGVDGSGAQDEGDAATGLFMVAAVIEVSAVPVDLVEQRRDAVGGKADGAGQVLEGPAPLRAAAQLGVEFTGSERSRGLGSGVHPFGVRLGSPEQRCAVARKPVS